MFSNLQIWFKGHLSIFLLIINTSICGTAVIVLVPFKWVLPLPQWRLFWTNIMIGIGSQYIQNNKVILELFTRITWELKGLENLFLDKKYLVVANHQSTMDIPVLQWIFFK